MSIKPVFFSYFFLILFIGSSIQAQHRTTAKLHLSHQSRDGQIKSSSIIVVSDQEMPVPLPLAKSSCSIENVGVVTISCGKVRASLICERENYPNRILMEVAIDEDELYSIEINCHNE